MQRMRFDLENQMAAPQPAPSTSDAGDDLLRGAQEPFDPHGPGFARRMGVDNMPSGSALYTCNSLSGSSRPTSSSRNSLSGARWYTLALSAWPS